MVDSPKWDPANPKTTCGLWPANMRDERSALGPDDLLSDPDGEALILPAETTPKNERRPTSIRPGPRPSLLHILQARRR
jgi:hypothetical protein